jgi:hypothetical protein
MNLQSFKDELLKIADLTQPSPTRPQPMSAQVKGPSIPRPGGMPLPTAAQGGSMWDSISAGMKGVKGAANPMVGILKNAAPTGFTPLPGATAVSKMVGANAHNFPRPAKVPSMSNINPWDVKHMSATASPATMTAATVPPRRMVAPPSGTHATMPAPGSERAMSSAPTMMPKVAAIKEALGGGTIKSYLKQQTNPQGLASAAKSMLGRGVQKITAGDTTGRGLVNAGNLAAQKAQQFMPKAASAKLAAELNAETRADVPKQDFAVSAKKSNTGKAAYPIPDRQHAESALGFSKMHGDTADYERVRAKVKKLYPDMIKEKAASVSESVGKGLGGRIGGFLEKHHEGADLAGLGILAAPGIYDLGHQAKNAITGKKVDKGEVARAGIETAGLGTLAAPGIAKMMRGAGSAVAHAA